MRRFAGCSVLSLKVGGQVRARKQMARAAEGPPLG